ncbi:hypothetical protein D3C86_1270660 [compost metagenome]
MERGWYADDVDIGGLQFSVGTQALGCHSLTDKRIKVGFHNGALAPINEFYDFGIDIDSEHLIASVRQKCSRWQPDIA